MQLITSLRKLINTFLLLSIFSIAAFAQDKILVENHYFPKSGKFEEVLSLRIAASKLLKEFGLSPGQVSVTRQTEDREIAGIVWQCEYESLNALNAELKTFTPEKERRFKTEILDKMKLLVNKHKRIQRMVVD